MRCSFLSRTGINFLSTRCALISSGSTRPLNGFLSGDFGFSKLSFAIVSSLIFDFAGVLDYEDPLSGERTVSFRIRYAADPGSVRLSDQAGTIVLVENGTEDLLEIPIDFSLDAFLADLQIVELESAARQTWSCSRHCSPMC